MGSEIGMPYRLENDETLTTGLRRCAREQLERAIDRLDTGISEDPVAAVHDARKAIKRERSVLRLARGPMKPSQRRRENARLRANARRLGQARDGEALLAALAGIDDRYAGQIPEATIMAVRQRLSHDRDLARARLMRDEVPTRVVDELRDALVRVDRWKLRGDGWSALSTGLEREYRRGRRAMKRAAQAPTPERMHAWRKRSKDLWYQLRLLQPLSPGTVRGQASDAHHLADQLGDLHDLAVLDAAVRGVQADLPADTDALIALIEHRAGQLSDEALRLGARVYAERPRAYLRRMRSYWRAWQGDARAAAAERPERVAELTRHSAVK
jgi:CHAD domain-containing protein